MKQVKSSFKYIVVASLVLCLAIFLSQINKKESVVLSIEPPIVTPSPTPVPEIPTQVSPDGTHFVSLKTQGATTEILVNDEVIVRRPVVPGLELNIPFNTWSPDNKYFFLNANSSTTKEYIVMMESGKNIAEESPYIYIADLFAQAHPDVEIVDVTGWAAPTLLIVNAKSAAENKMTYWFDVQSKKFIRLSNYFY